MRRLMSISVFVLLASFVCAGRAIPADVTFDPVDSKLLPSNHVKCLYQDSEGFVWIGTNNGLARYDGTDVISYSSCLQEYSFLYEVIEDSDGRLLLATDKGLVILDKVTGRAEAMVDGIAVSSLSKDPDGNIWAGGEDGLFVRPADGESFGKVEVMISGEPLEGVIDILSDNEGKVWMTTWQKGLYMYDPSVGETIVFKKDDLAYSYVLHQDSDNDIWVGTWGCGLLRLAEDFCISSGYVKYDTATPDGETLLDEVIYAINDVDGYILVGGQKGFSIIDRESEDTRFFAPGTSEYSLPYNQVNSIIVTANGNVYLGLYGGGMCSVADKVIPYAVDPLSEIRRRFGTNTVHGIFASDSSWIWMGIPDNGFVLYDPVSQMVVRHNEIPAFRNLLSISSAFAIKERSCTGEICIGTYSEGLWIYDAAAGKVRTITTEICPAMRNHNILALENDSLGNLWIGTGAGAYVLSPDDELMSLEDFASGQEQIDGHVQGIAASEDGRVFLATTSSGIIEVDVASHAYTVHVNAGSAVPFTNVIVDINGDVWAGSLNDGLYFYDSSSGTIAARMPIDGLESDCITNLTQLPDGEIWVTTASELLTFFPEGENGQLKVTRYVSDLGLDFSTNSSMVRDDAVIFGTTDGIFRYALPDDILHLDHNHTLVITDLIVNGRSYRDMGKFDEDINYLDKIKVKRGDNVEIRYTLLDYNHFFSPVYTVSCDGQSWETALSSMTCDISRIHTYVDIQYLPCGQAKHLVLKASVRWPYLVAVASVVLVLAGLYVFRRKEEPKKHDVIEFEIDKINFTSPDEELLQKAMDVIQKHISDADFKQDDFIKEMGTSRTMLTEKLKELTGFTPISLIMEVRLKTAYNTIMSAQEKLRISDVAYSVGFNDAKYFGTCFRKKYGLTPKELMNQRLEAIKDSADQ